MVRRCECTCCIETYLAHGQILLHPFFPCYGVSNRFCSRDLQDPCVQLERRERRIKKNYAGSKTLPASIKEKETHWPEVP